jgi:hypothetical protein
LNPGGSLGKFTGCCLDGTLGLAHAEKILHNSNDGSLPRPFYNIFAAYQILGARASVYPLYLRRQIEENAHPLARASGGEGGFSTVAKSMVGGGSWGAGGGLRCPSCWTAGPAWDCPCK